MKTCGKCKEVKNKDEFSKNKCRNDGLQDRCKVCESTAHRASYVADPNKFNTRSTAWAADETNRFKVALKYSRANAKKSGYLPCSATAEEIEAAFIGHCHICDKTEEENGKRLCVDHDHETGEFRGWLCVACNVKDVLVIKEAEEK